MRHLNKHVLTLVVAAATTMAVPAGAADQESTGEKWSDTLESMKSFTADQRDQALEAGRETLDAMDRRIEDLESWTKEQWDSLSAETRDERAATLEFLRKQRNEAAEWYGGMKHSSAEAWGSVKQGFVDSYGKLQNAYDDAVESMNRDENTESAE